MLARADLHIHTVLSPCGDLDMSPRNIVRAAREKGLDIIGIADHNCTRQAGVIQELGRENGLVVLAGAEVTTAEEAHCLAFFPTGEALERFQAFLDQHLPPIPNNPAKFGYQVAVNAEEEIVHEEPYLLISALDTSIETVEQTVHGLGGIFIPAHIDKPAYSILSQLGFVPPDLTCDALEISPRSSRERITAEHPYLATYAFTTASDAHYVEDIGKVYTELLLPDFSFEAIRQAIRQGIPSTSKI